MNEVIGLTREKNPRQGPGTAASDKKKSRTASGGVVWGAEKACQAAWTALQRAEKGLPMRDYAACAVLKLVYICARVRKGKATDEDSLAQ